jgi:hypothetical protein
MTRANMAGEMGKMLNAVTAIIDGLKPQTRRANV